MENMLKLGFDIEKIQNFQFKRIDLTNPDSILNYGGDVIEIIDNIVVALEQLMHSEDTSKINFSEDIAKINAFDDELKKLETKDNKEKNNNFIQQLVSALIEKFPIISPNEKEEEEKTDTYADLYTKHCKNIDILCQKMYEDQTNVKNTMTTNDELLRVLDAVLKLLAKVIEVGEDDKNKCIEHLGELSANPSNEREIKTMKLHISIFERKLSDLKEVMAVTDIQYDELSTKKIANMEIIMQHDKFLKTTAPTLKLQSHNIIGTKQQADRLNSIEQLSKAVNQNMLKNSAVLGENIAKAERIGSSGFIDVKTLMTLKDNTIKALESIQKYQATIETKRDENSKAVDGIIKELSSIRTRQINLLTVNTETYADNSNNDKFTTDEKGTQFVKKENI